MNDDNNIERTEANEEPVELTEQPPKALTKGKREYKWTDKRKQAFEKMLKAKELKRSAQNSSNGTIHKLKKYLELKAHLKSMGLELDDKIQINEQDLVKQLAPKPTTPPAPTPVVSPEPAKKKRTRAKKIIVLDDTTTDAETAQSDADIPQIIKIPKSKVSKPKVIPITRDNTQTTLKFV